MQVIYNHPHLEEIELRGNKITDLGMKHFFQNHKKLKTLRTLDFGLNLIKDSIENTQIKNSLILKGFCLKF